MVERFWRPQDARKDGWLVVGRAGGPGTFWEGYEYTLGVYRCRWMAGWRAWRHVLANPWRMARLERVEGHGPCGCPAAWRLPK